MLLSLHSNVRIIASQEVKVSKSFDLILLSFERWTWKPQVYRVFCFSFFSLSVSLLLFSSFSWPLFLRQNEEQLIGWSIYKSSSLPFHQKKFVLGYDSPTRFQFCHTWLLTRENDECVRGFYQIVSSRRKRKERKDEEWKEEKNERKKWCWNRFYSEEHFLWQYDETELVSKSAILFLRRTIWRKFDDLWFNGKHRKEFIQIWIEDTCDCVTQVLLLLKSILKL